jgi:glutathione synthase/RimK-type ligase-like ATP-grasp enzyme
MTADRLARVAFATAPAIPQLTADDRLAVRELEQRGVQVVPLVWSDPCANWDEADLIVLRSMWDYHLHPAAFEAWLDRLEQVRPSVWNPVSVARWNLDKRYLRFLSDAGVPIVPTVLFERGERPSVARVMDELGWSEAVAKPLVSSTAYRTWRIPRANADQHDLGFHQLLDERAAMLQEYQPSIRTDGEWSLTLVGGQLTHTVVKRAIGQDFRVQEEFGGTTDRASETSEMMDVALRALQEAPGPWLYARVDGVRTARGFLLSELEMLEPGLFFMNAPEAAAVFADAIVERLERI